MAEIRYRLFLNDKPAKRQQLDDVEEITVEQAVDVAWEARLQIPVCASDKGAWEKQEKDLMAAFSRVRVEVKVGDGAFVPLIDGPVVESESFMSSQPGQSTVTLVFHDDSAHLNQQDKIARFDGKLDHEIAREIFDETSQIAKKDIEKTAAPSSSLKTSVVQRGTKMQILRLLAKRQGMHAYVLPGDTPGASVGCFKRFPTKPDKFPPLILLGSERNIENFNVWNDSQSPAHVTAFAVDLLDKNIVKRTSRSRDVDLLGEEATVEKESRTAAILARPEYGDAMDLDRTAQAQSEHSSFALRASGEVIGQCYTGVLLPYRVIRVKAGQTRLSGAYLISRVEHRLTRSEYRQSFTVRRNARSTTEKAGGGNIPGGIF